MTGPEGFADLSCPSELNAKREGEGNAAAPMVTPANSRILRRESLRDLRPVFSVRSDFMCVGKLAPGTSPYFLKCPKISSASADLLCDRFTQLLRRRGPTDIRRANFGLGQ